MTQKALLKANWQTRSVWENAHEQQAASQEQASQLRDHSQRLSEYASHVHSSAILEVQAIRCIFQDTRDRAQAALQHSQSGVDQRVADAEAFVKNDDWANHVKAQALLNEFGDVQPWFFQRSNPLLSNPILHKMNEYHTSVVQTQSGFAQVAFKGGPKALRCHIRKGSPR